MNYTAEIYKDRKKEYRSRIKAKNGKIIFDSGEGYNKKSNCRRTLNNFVKYFDFFIIVIDLTKK